MISDTIKKEIKLKIFKRLWNIKGRFVYYGQNVFFPKNSVIFQRAVTEGIYESDNLRIINSLIKPNTEVFDIGANIGIMAIPFLEGHNDIKVISVEASPNTLPYLKKTQTASAYADRWVIIDKAVSDSEKVITFNLADEADGAYDSMLDTKRIAFTRSVEIDCTTIDTIWNQRNKPEVSFIKIDIEGGDLLALKGGMECIKTCRPSILLEWNYINIKAFGLVNKDFFDFFQSINYTCLAAPQLNKVTALNELDLFSNLTENFVLIPN
ncbi:MAG: FkbM family methyltransferase [Sphingobacteriales bacterium]